MPKVAAKSGGFTPSAGLEQRPGAPIEEFEEAAVEHDAGRIAMGPFDGELPAADEIGHDAHDRAQNKPGRGGQAAPAFERKLELRRIMTGELTPARHVPSAATRGWEPGSNPPHDAMRGSGHHTQANPTLAIDTSGRTKRDRSDNEDTRADSGSQVKASLPRRDTPLGIIPWIGFDSVVPCLARGAARTVDIAKKIQPKGHDTKSLISVRRTVHPRT